MKSGVNIAKSPRLKFIDLARSIAILLMLEGHFVGLTLMDEARDVSSPIYIAWDFVRGFTAPLFFTVAGMIFVYLLAGDTEGFFLKRVRVKKGLRRVAELLFWGYALQVSVKNLPQYIQGDFETWLFAFHVLQCIGISLLALIGVAALREKVGRLSLEIWLSAALLITLAGYIWLKKLPDGSVFPDGLPAIIQNAFLGHRSVFPITPWLGFSLLGGIMGAYTRRERLLGKASCRWFFIVAAGLKVIWLAVVLLPISEVAAAGLAWFTGRSAEVVLVLGLLRWIELRWGIGLAWLLRTGRETFAIYVVHVMILYGGVFGFGLNRWLTKELDSWQAAAGALGFMAVFVLFAQVLQWRRQKLIRCSVSK